MHTLSFRYQWRIRELEAMHCFQRSSNYQASKMRVSFWFLIMCFQAAQATKIIYRNHSCVPSAYSKMCILEHFHYDSKETHVIHSFPPNLHHVRITNEARFFRNAGVSKINGKLHSILGKPKILDVENQKVRVFELPRALEQGIFRRLGIRTLTVEPGTDIPKVVYLDLSNNYLKDIATVSSLVNLEVLLLVNNFIENIEPTTMQSLTKLRVLILGFNYLTKITMNNYPKSLTHLNLIGCEIESFNYGYLYYPSMEVFNIEANRLSSLDASALMLAMPKLKMVRLGWNHFDQEELQEALFQLERHNISIRDEADEANCKSYEQVFEGVCIAEPDPPRSVLREIFLSLVVILVAIALGVILRWVFIQMQGSK